MTSKVLLFNQRVPIGEVNGMPVFASFDFLRYIEDQRKRSGGDTAMTNIELEGAANTAQATAEAAQDAADAAQADATQALSEIAAIASYTPVYMQDTEPPATSIWFKTDPTSGLVIDIMQVTP